MAMLGGYTVARDPFVVDESNTVRPLPVIAAGFPNTDVPIASQQLSNKVAAVLAELERGHSTLRAAKASNPPSTEFAMAVDT